MNSQNDELFNQILFCYKHRRIESAKKEHIFFSHYTSAAAAMNILYSKSLWMRNAREMNDYSEVIYGEQLLSELWRTSPTGIELKSILDDIHPEIHARVSNILESSKHKRTLTTFILSLSEHRNEDNYGKLSMWRAYGGNPNIAIIFNCISFFERNNSNIIATPVIYGDKESILLELDILKCEVEKNNGFLRNIDPAMISTTLARSIHSLTLSIKHAGFQEEREWRIIYSHSESNLTPPSLEPKGLEASTQIINGVPQMIMHVNFGIIANNNSYKTQDLLDRIIIGPNQRPETIAAPLVHALLNLGIKNPEVIIKNCGIPLRR